MQINFSTNEETVAALRRQALKAGRSVSEIIRTYIEWGLEDEKEAGL